MCQYTRHQKEICKRDGERPEVTEAVQTRIMEETYFSEMQKYKEKTARTFSCAYGRERNAVKQVSKAGQTDVTAETDVTGENRDRLGQAVAAYIGEGSAVAVSSEKEALRLALRLASERIGEGSAAAADSGKEMLRFALRPASERIGESSPEETGEAAAGGILSGRRVFCSDFASQVPAAMILACGGMPVFIDASSDDWGMDPEALAAAFGRYPDVKLVLYTHVYGFPGRIDEIRKICETQGALLIEDASEAFGARYGNRMCGSFGDYGIIGFENGGRKIDAAGKIAWNAGGILLLRDQEGADAAETVRNQVRPSDMETVSGLCSALYSGRERYDVTESDVRELRDYLDRRIRMKKKIYERYADRLADLDVRMNPYADRKAVPNYQTSCMMISENSLSPVRWNLRDGRWTYEYDDVHGRTCPPEISDVLEASGVDGQLVHKPLHLLPTYWGFEFVAAEEEMWDGETGCGNGSGAELATRAGACEISGTLGEGEYLFERCLCLPSDVWMTEEEQERVIEMIYDCFNSREWGRRL
jgi:dTDP-4-amino-4,6-dideoxygalactose transaminase